jgi:hypothetical protein
MPTLNERLVAAMVGGAAGELCTLPICTLRTRYVSDAGRAKSTARSLLTGIVREEGFGALFRGAQWAVLSQCVSMGSKFTLFWALKDARGTPTSFALRDIGDNMINGLLSGVAGGMLAHPLDVWKTHRQRPEANLRSDISRHGWRVFLRGLPATVSKNALLYGLLFPGYELVKSSIQQKNAAASAIAAAATTVCTTAVTQSVEYWKLRRMAGQTVRFTARDAYRGYLLTLGRALPHFLITTTVIERLLSK